MTEDYDDALPGAQTELAPSASETAAHTAWALDDGPEWRPPFWTPGRVVGVTVGFAALAVIVTAGMAGYHLRGNQPVATPAPATIELPVSATTSMTATTTKEPPPPPPVTVTSVVVESKAPPRVARTQSTWTYDLEWGGATSISVIEHADGVTRTRFIGNGSNPGMGTGWTGDLIGVDPVITDFITWVSCKLYVNGVQVMSDFATKGDGTDVACLMTLTR